MALYIITFVYFIIFLTIISLFNEYIPIKLFILALFDLDIVLKKSLVGFEMIIASFFGFNLSGCFLIKCFFIEVVLPLMSKIGVLQYLQTVFFLLCSIPLTKQ